MCIFLHLLFKHHDHVLYIRNWFTLVFWIFTSSNTDFIEVVCNPHFIFLPGIAVLLLISYFGDIVRQCQCNANAGGATVLFAAAYNAEPRK